MGGRALCAVDIAEYFGDGSKGGEGDFAVDIDGGQHLGEVGVLLHFDAAMKGDFKDLAGQSTRARGKDAWQVTAGRVVAQSDGEIALSRRPAGARIMHADGTSCVPATLSLIKADRV